MSRNEIKPVPPMTIPYNTGKVKIGLSYVPPRRDMDIGLHAERLQTVLMGWDVPWYERMGRLIKGK